MHQLICQKKVEEMKTCHVILLLTAGGLICSAVQIFPVPEFQIQGKFENNSDLYPFSFASCIAPPPAQFNYTWFFAGKTLAPMEKYHVVSNNTLSASLIWIQNLSYTDAGNYTCVVVQPSPLNGSESYSATIQLILLVKVEVLGPTNITVNVTVTSEVELSCEMSQYIHPDGDLWWFKGEQRIDVTQSKYSIVYRNGTKLAHNGGSNVTSSRVSVLRISKLTSSDSGVYTCRLYGTDQSGDISLTVSAPVINMDEVSFLPAFIASAAGGAVIAITLAIVVVILKKKESPVVTAEPLYDNGMYESSSQINIQNRTTLSAGSLPTEPQPYETQDNKVHQTPALHSGCQQHSDMPAGARCKTFSCSNQEKEAANTSNLEWENQWDSLDNFSSNDVDYYSEPIDPSILYSNYESTGGSGLPYTAVYEVPKQPEKEHRPLSVTWKNIHWIGDLGLGQFGQVILCRTVGLSFKDFQLSEVSCDSNGSALVAVKTLRHDAKGDLVTAFDKEVKFMSRLRHDNVVRLLGVCTEGESFIMMEYMENGDLNQFLQKQKVMPDTISGLKENEITPTILLYMGVQIANGMHYLSSHRFVHRDLATRNCLVGRDFVVKISDFGMSRSLYESAYYRVQGTVTLPIRWMATETFYGKFSVKSDSWAFGVTMWEIYTLGKLDAYEEMTDEEVIADAIRGPDRKLLSRPELCPQKVYDVMLRCWTHDPRARASFGEIYSQLFLIYTRPVE